MQPELQLDVSLLCLMTPGKTRQKIRKGFWRHQPCGYERLSRKRIWIKTRIINNEGQVKILNDQPSWIYLRAVQQELTLA